MVLSSSGDDLTERGEIPTYSEASTPEWSDVEHGNVVSPVSSQDSEIELIGPRHPPAPLWALNLSLNEFLEWCRPGRVQEFALGQFEEVTNVNSILWPVWWTIERDMLDDDERGVIPVTDEVRMMKLSTTMILFSDGIIRPVFLAWLLDEMSGRDRTVAIIREPARPIVRPYPAQTGAATPELSKAAPPKFGRVAKSPTVSPPPLGYTQQPDVLTALLQVVDEGASSASSSSLPIAKVLGAAAAKSKASAAKANPPSKASAASTVKANSPPKASAASAVKANPPPKASAASAVKANPPPKASAAPSPNPATSAAARGSTESHARAMRCVCVEDEANDDPPWLAGAGMKEGTAYRLECDDQPAACAVVSEHPSVLVDSGANETIRPWTQGFSEAGCKRTSVVTASGDRIPALRTRDGELRIQSSHDTKDWLLSVRRLVEAGGSFDWTPEAAVVTYVDAGGKMQQVQCKITLEWEEFRPIRVALSQAYRGKQTRASVAVGAEDDLKTSEACTMEVLNEIMCAEEVYRLSAAEKDEEVRAVWSSEARAKELLNQDALTYEAVWQVVQEAHLKGQRTRRQEKMVDQSSDRVQIWIFGMFCHGGMSGVTNITRQRPFLCKLLVRFLKQELPTLSFTTIALAIDATLKPHRDLANAKYSLAGILGLSEFEGGKLWIEDAEGKIKRRVTQDQIKTGVLLDISQQAKIFDSRRWHGADKHRGTRATLTGYTARQLYNLDHDLVETLRNLGFQLPPTAKAGTASSISDQHAAINNTTCSTSKHTSTLTTSLTSPETQDEDDDDDDDGVSVFGFAGFVNSGTSGRCEDCGVVLEGLRRDSEPPWTALAAEIEGASSGFDEAAQQRALDLLQRKCAEGLYEKKCPDCLESHGHKRKCRRLTADMVSKGTLSMDLSGPHPASFAGHRYFLAANLSVEDGEDIPFSRLLFTKKTEEVARALISVMCQIVSLAQGIPQIFRIHSDAGKEFTGGLFQEAVSKCSIWPTMSAPYTPQQNGKAERLVGPLKSAAGALLLHAQLPLQLWSEAILEATFLRRSRALKLLIPKDRPKMGDTALVRKPPLSMEHPFEPRAEEGVFPANDERTPGGARVMVVRDGATSVRVVRLPVLKDKPVARWKLERGLREGVVWISTTGDLRWDAPPSDMITVEESVGEIQPWNDVNAASEILRERLRKHMVPETERQLFGLFGHRRLWLRRSQKLWIQIQWLL